MYMNEKNSFKSSFVSKLKEVKFWVFSFFLGLALATGISFAWNAVWHGTNWIQSGKIITPREIAENMEYLKQQVDSLQTQINNISNSTSTSITVQDLPSGSVVAGCGPSFNYWGLTQITCWGGAIFRGLYSTCPSGTTKVVMYYYKTVQNSGFYDTNIVSFLCVKS